MDVDQVLKNLFLPHLSISFRLCHCFKAFGQIYIVGNKAVSDIVQAFISNIWVLLEMV